MKESQEARQALEEAAPWLRETYGTHREPFGHPMIVGIRFEVQDDD